MITQAPRGTKDIFGKEAVAWKQLEEAIGKLCADYGIGEIRTPVFEHTELFERGVGDTTDVVQKEMYTFTDRSDRSLTLRPEGTAGVARAFIEHKLYGGTLPLKLYYAEPMFRYEKPQAGRMRQFHQFGIEYIGPAAASADAEVISVAHELFRRLEMKDITLYINSLGCKNCRADYHTALIKFLQERQDGLCENCKERLEKNPLRVLDCKERACKTIVKDAPSILDSLDEECRNHFEDLKSRLTALEIPFEVNPGIVRGLDYYTRTVFEFVSEGIGAQGTVCGGGRYDNMIEDCGGPATACVGFGMGMERVLMILEKMGRSYPIRRDFFLGHIGEAGALKAATIAMRLRREGFSAETELLNRSVKAQMKYADKMGFKYAAIIGDNEVDDRGLKFKEMATGEEHYVYLVVLTNYLGQVFNKRR